GIIPWDDDIDVTMPRKDYKLFLDIVRNEYSDSYVVHSWPDKNYIYPYAKFGFRDSVLWENLLKRKYQFSLSIDIFPNDGYPEDETVFKKYNNCKKAIISMTYVFSDRKFLKRIYLFIKGRFLGLLGVPYFVNKQIQMLSECKEDSADYIICQGAGWGGKGRLKKEIYYDRRLYDFNNIKVWGIRNYHDHLTNLYGDYMTLPSENKRHPSHDARIMVKKDVYKKYLGVNK
ncbi:MAG: LicD family protein, partial [Lachnospiraceae bacterium]|nr:LicD family protein [Lachnospiraceae bacterium]